ncbi:unnamed protein product [Trichobilharzia regenti]|nr:unnamed protein product [Trichobilharzia regenti]
MNSNQLLKEFQKFQDLIHRPIVSDALQSEKELLLGYLEVSLKEHGEGKNKKKHRNVFFDELLPHLRPAASYWSRLPTRTTG